MNVSFVRTSTNNLRHIRSDWSFVDQLRSPSPHARCFEKYMGNRFGFFAALIEFTHSKSLPRMEVFHRIRRLPR